MAPILTALVRTNTMGIGTRNLTMISSPYFKQAPQTNCFNKGKIEMHKCSVEVYIGGLTHHWQANAFDINLNMQAVPVAPISTALVRTNTMGIADIGLGEEQRAWLGWWF